MSEPREWWIDYNVSGLGEAYEIPTWDWSNTKAIQVIEKSAYDALVADKKMIMETAVWPQRKLNDELWAKYQALEDKTKKLMQLLSELDEEIDPRGGDHDPGFITQKGIDIFHEALELKEAK